MRGAAFCFRLLRPMPLRHAEIGRRVEIRLRKNVPPEILWDVTRAGGASHVP
jgi:hypothetical protein